MEIDKTHDGQLTELVRAFHHKQHEDDDDTNSDSDQLPKLKCSKAQSSEFDAEGLLKKTPEYKGMNISGLVLFKSVNDDICRAIRRNKFFPLAKMYTGEEITTTQLGHVTVTTTKNLAKTITKKSVLFFLLYNFGQFYLQLYPEKAAGFLEYLGFLTKVCDRFTVTALVELDNQIKKEYVQHPQWNWDQTNSIIDKIYTYFAREADNLQPSTGPSSSGGKQSKQGKPKFQFMGQQSVLAKVQSLAQVQKFVSVPPPMPHFPGAYALVVPFQAPASGPMAPQPFFAPQQNSGKKGQKGKKESAEARHQKALQANPNIVNERCTAHNFSGKGCVFWEACLCLHVCFNCGDPSHKAPQCPHPCHYVRTYWSNTSEWNFQVSLLNKYDTSILSDT